MPIIGSLKSAIETVTGRNIVSGQNLGWVDRVASAVSLIPVAGGFLKNGGKIAKYAAEFKVIQDMMRFSKGAADNATKKLTKFVLKTCKLEGLNSFTPGTLVRTLTGLAAISGLTVGTPVLAFNESTQQNEYYPITAVHKNTDPAITYLILKDGQTGQAESVTTTPEHPFYVTERSDTQPRPKPEGHEDLSEKWVGAGHLKIGDQIKQADGTIGLVANVINVQKTQEMFNLTVSEAHTYYVGQDGWLVHNCNVWGGTGLEIKGGGRYFFNDVQLPKNATPVIGKLDDITRPGALGTGEYNLLRYLRDLPEDAIPSQQAQNISLMDDLIKMGSPIKDVTVNSRGRLINDTGFMKLERDFIRNNGWTYNPNTQLWSNPERR